MKTKLLSACAFMMLASAAHGAQDAMTAKPMSAPAMSSDVNSSGMTKTKKSKMHHSKRAAKHKAMHKAKDSMSSSETSN